MSKFEVQVKKYQKALQKIYKGDQTDETLLRAIAKSLGPSIYQKDASLVACSDTNELKRLKKSFLIKKMGLNDSKELDEAMLKACSRIKKARVAKYRVVFYYLLVDELQIADQFNKVAKSKKSGKKKEEKTNEVPVEEIDVYESAFDGVNDGLINRYALYAAGAGLIPVPLIDLASITAVQFSMIRSLSRQYDHVDFDDQRTKSAIAALMGGLGSFELGLFARVLFKGIPLFGPIIGGTAMSGFAYFTTKLIGEIFDEHFSGGGDLTLEERTVQKMKETFTFEMKKARSKS